MGCVHACVCVRAHACVHLYHFFLPKLRDHYGSGWERLLRTRSERWLQGNSVFQMQHSNCTCPVVTSCKAMTNAQARPSPCMEMGSGHKVPPLAEELREGESVFSKSVAPAKSTTLPWKTTHRRIYRQHKLNFMGFIFKDTKLGEWKRGLDRGGVGGKGDYDQNTLYKILRGLIKICMDSEHFAI